MDCPGTSNGRVRRQSDTVSSDPRTTSRSPAIRRSKSSANSGDRSLNHTKTVAVGATRGAYWRRSGGYDRLEREVTRDRLEAVPARPAADARPRVQVRRAVVEVVVEQPVAVEPAHGTEAPELRGDRAARRIAALRHVGPLPLDVRRSVHARGDHVVGGHVRRVPLPLAQQVVEVALLDLAPVLVAEQAPRRRELLDAHYVRARRRARLVPQAVHGTEHVRP